MAKSSDLWTAAHRGDLDSIWSNLADNVDVNAKSEYGYTALLLAANRGHEGAIELLLEHGVAVDGRSKGGWTALHSAAQRGHVGVAAMLLAKGADPNATNDIGSTPLEWAVNGGHDRVVTLLLDNGVSADALVPRVPAIVAAAQRGHTAIVATLASRGAGMNAKKSALTIARRHGHQDIVNLLLHADPGL